MRTALLIFIVAFVAGPLLAQPEAPPAKDVNVVNVPAVTVANTNALAVTLEHVAPDIYVINRAFVDTQSQDPGPTVVQDAIVADSVLLSISFSILVMAAPESGGEQMVCSVGTQRRTLPGSAETLWSRAFLEDDVDFFFSGHSDHIRLDPGVVFRAGDTLLTFAQARANGGFSRCDVRATYLLQRLPQ